MIRIGGLGPLTLPGLPWAGRELRDGMNLAVQQLNGSGGVLGRRLTLLFEDTHGRPEAGVAAIERLLEESVHALAGEFHSVVADAIVEPVERLDLPFVCASATLDDITARRLGFVFRLAPPQSYGWTIYADFLASQGFRHVVALQEDSLYWNNGSRAIEARLRNLGVQFTRLSARPELADAASWIRQVKARQSESPVPDILLLLMAFPEPLRSVVGEAHNHGLAPPACFFGDPAGRSVFPDWWEIAGTDATEVPFLSYARPDCPKDNGSRMSMEFKKQYGREPTFVAFEGFDSMLVLARAFEDAGTTEPASVRDALRRIDLEGTRGTIRFSTEHEGVVHQQWKWPPVCVVAFSHARQSSRKPTFSGMPSTVSALERSSRAVMANKHFRAEVNLTIDGDVAFASALNGMRGRQGGEDQDLWYRTTMCRRKANGRWRIVHDHSSVPFYMDGSYRAAVDLEP